MSETLQLRIGAEVFATRLLRDLTPRSCKYLMSLLPYTGKLLHARWSGEALWAPLGPAFRADVVLPLERPTSRPAPGEILLYGGGVSEPELYLPYGPNRFACKAGPLEGEPVLAIEDGLERLAMLGHEAQWKGAMEMRIEVSP